MKIACITILDNGNIMRHLARGLRDYCHQDATCYVLGADTYANIPDPTITRYTGTPDDWTRPDADAYLLNDITYYQLEHLFWDQPRLVKCNGTWARKNAGWIHHDHLRHGTLYVSSPLDYSLASALPFSIQTLPPLIDHRLLPPPAFPEDKIIVGHAPTSTAKGTVDSLRALQPYRQSGAITIDVITNTPWQDAIQRKARCHIFIDQVTAAVPTYWNRAEGAIGVNALESLALGSVVLANPLHPYVRQHYPDIRNYVFPFFDKDHWQDLHSFITEGLLHPTQMAQQRQWTLDHFDLEPQAPKWLQWLTYVTEQGGRSRTVGTDGTESPG